MQGIETIRNGLQTAHKIIWDDLGLDCSEINNALTALNQLEEKLNKPVDVDRVANIIEERLKDYGFTKGDCSLMKVASVVAQSAIAEINSQRMGAIHVKGE